MVKLGVANTFSLYTVKIGSSKYVTTVRRLDETKPKFYITTQIK